MSITESTVTTYRSTTLPKAAERTTLAEAEADEQRGVELEKYLALFPELSAEQWAIADAVAWEAAGRAREAAREAARDAAAWDAARDAARDAAAWDAAAWDAAAWDAAEDAACAVVARDLITAEQFDTLTAPMRAAGISFETFTISEDTP